MDWKATLAFLWRTQRLALVVFAAALVALSVFAVGALDNAKRFRDPDRRQQPIEPWMTAQFVGRSYHIRPDIADDLFGVDGRDARRITMEQIAADKGMSFEDLQTLVIETARAGKDRKQREKDADDWFQRDDKKDKPPKGSKADE